MNESLVTMLVGFFGLAAIATILVQLGKNLLPSREDAEGNELGPRRWLSPGILVITTLLGLLFGFVQGDSAGENGLLYMTAWAVVGLLIGATSTGLYSGLKALIPNVFSTRGWIGGG